MQIYANICKYMHRICKEYAKICIEYTQIWKNMQKYAIICKIYKNMQKYAAQFVPQKDAKICKLYACYMQKHAKYAITIFICKICKNMHSPVSPHFADVICIGRSIMGNNE